MKFIKLFESFESQNLQEIIDDCLSYIMDNSFVVDVIKKSIYIRKTYKNGSIIGDGNDIPFNWDSVNSSIPMFIEILQESFPLYNIEMRIKSKKPFLSKILSMNLNNDTIKLNFTPQEIIEGVNIDREIYLIKIELK